VRRFDEADGFVRGREAIDAVRHLPSQAPSSRVGVCEFLLRA
jgi:hypothetical protein